MISFEQARALVAANYFKQAQEEDFEFEPWVADYGWQNEIYFMLVAGPKEWLVDGIEEMQPIDDIARLVEKQTGKYIETNSSQIFDDLDTFEPIGDVPQNFQ